MKSDVQSHSQVCPDRCPGCQHRSLTRAESESMKLKWLQTQLSPWAEVLEPVRGVNDSLRFQYRNKVCLHAQWDLDHWRFGLRVRKLNAEHFSDTEVIHIPHCPIHSLRVQKIIEALSRTLPSAYGFPLVYLSVAGSLLTLVVKAPSLDASILHSLRSDYDWKSLGLEGVWINFNPSAGNRVFSSRGWVLLYGEPRVQDDDFFHGPDSFQQLIPLLHEDSLREAQRFLVGVEARSSQGSVPQKESIAVLDLYSGIGRSLRIWQILGVSYIGVELNGDAFQCLQLNLEPASPTLRGRVSERLPQLEKWRLAHSSFDLCAYVNPPRLGLESEVIDWLIRCARPLRLVYLSCSAGTLRRDLAQFVDAGYQIRRIIPYDFFPGTIHIETLVCLDRKQ